MIGLSMYGRFGIAYKVARQLPEMLGNRPLLLVGGTVPPTEVDSLKAAGVDEVFSADPAWIRLSNISLPSVPTAPKTNDFFRSATRTNRCRCGLAERKFPKS